MAEIGIPGCVRGSNVGRILAEIGIKWCVRGGNVGEIQAEIEILTCVRGGSPYLTLHCRQQTDSA